MAAGKEKLLGFREECIRKYLGLDAGCYLRVTALIWIIPLGPVLTSITRGRVNTQRGGKGLLLLPFEEQGNRKATLGIS